MEELREGLKELKGMANS
jgi:hypothetical protein